MSLSWDYVNKIITIPRADLVFVDPVYELDTIWLMDEIRAEISDEMHIWVEDVYVRTSDVGPIVGTVYAGTLQLINGWRLQFDPDEAYSVLFTGSNNDFWDVAGGKLMPQNIQPIPTNSAGLIVNTPVDAQAVWAYIFGTGNTAAAELEKARKAAELARNLSA